MELFIGSAANAAAIVIGATFGLLLKKGIPKRFETLLMDALALVIFLIGLMTALKTQEIILMVVSLVLGGLIGELLRLEDRLLSMGKKLEARLLPPVPKQVKTKAGPLDSDRTVDDSSDDTTTTIDHTTGKRKPGSLAIGFVHASLVFCIGSMAIIGSLESGLSGQHHTLLAKSLLDGIISIFFAAALGAGVLFSAIPVLLYEGGMTAGASALKSFLSTEMVTEISAIGGILIMALAVNMTKLKAIRVVNLLPSLLVALLWFLIRAAMIG